MNLDDALDQILEDSGVDEALDALLQKVQESSHLSDELVARYLDDRLREEERRKVRRHILFCDACSSHILDLARQRNDLGIPAGDDVRADFAIAQRRAVAQRESKRLTRAVATCALLFGISALAWWLTPRVNVFAVDATLAESPSHVELMISRRGELVPAAGSFLPGEEIVVRFELPRRDALWVYALAIDDQGRLHGLTPPRGKSARHELGVDGVFQVPAAVKGALSPRGWSLDRIPGDRVGIVVLTAHQRQPMFEGELRDLVALPRIQELAGLGKAPLDEHLVAAFGRFLKERGYAADTRSYCLDRRSRP